VSRLLFCGASLILTAAGSAATGITASRDVPVRATKADEVRPVASTNAFAWAVRRWSSPHKAHYDTYVQVGKAAPVKVNAPGTSALPGGISGDTLALEQWHRGRGDIVFYSLSRKRLFAPPGGVNSSRADESAPSLSGQWLLFERVHGPAVEFALRNLVTGEMMQLLARPLGGRVGPRPGDGTQVNGNFAVFSFGRLTVFDIASRKLTGFPPGGVIPELGFSPPSVSRNGTVYAPERYMGGRCGERNGRSLSRLTPSADTYPVVTSVPSGFDIGSSYAVDEGTHTTIYYTRLNCETGRSDIYKTVDANPPRTG
jgi:hypothetical protein